MVEVLLLLIKRFEGLHRLHEGLVYPYICPAGFWTQGWGMLVKDGSASPITHEQADAQLIACLPFYTKATFDLCPRLYLEPPEVGAAIADFTFNLGSGRLRQSTLRKRVNSGDWDAACDELAKWVNGGGRKLPGLILRRHTEIQLIRNAYGNVN